MRNAKSLNGKICLIVFFLSFFLTPIISSGEEVTIEGRVFTENGPLKEARVHVYKNYPDLGTGVPLLISNPTDVQGFYSFTLEPGEYYFTAKGIETGKAFFSYHGSNPIKVGKNNIWLSLMANEEKQPAYTSGPPSIQGTVTYKGKPVQDANIAFYPMESKEFKGLGFLAGKSPVFMAAVAEDGSFTFSLSPNKYVVIARKIQSGKRIRPLMNGDLYCYAPTNPIEVKPDMTVRIEVPCYPKGDRLSFVDTPKIKTNDYLTVEKLRESGHSGIKGKVTDSDGKPVQGVYVIAYRVVSSTLSHETVNITETDAEGNYFIHLDSDGSYGLVVRESIGGEPRPEELTGLHHKNPWQGIVFQSGQIIDNIHIQVAPQLDDTQEVME